jgi:osmotically-inducible protein OsmY
MRALRTIVLAATMGFALTGCVVVISDEGITAADGIHAGDRSSSRDRALAVRVREAFDAEPQLKDTDLSVSAHDGVVTLRGELDSVAALERAVALAKAAEGVDKVISRLRLEVR